MGRVWLMCMVCVALASGSATGPVRAAAAPDPVRPTSGSSGPTVAAAADRWVRAPGAFPLGSGTVQMAPGPDGGLYVLAVDGGSVLALLDSRGRPRAGWPVANPAVACAWWTEPEWQPSWALVAASDGSVRVLCPVVDVGHTVGVRAFAFDSRGRSLRGWPVDLPASVVGNDVRVVGTRVVAIVSEGTRRDPYEASTAAWWLVSVSAEGTVRTGKRQEVQGADWPGPIRLGPDGLAYRWDPDDEGGEVAAIGLDGEVRGWPARTSEFVVDVVFGPPGFVDVIGSTLVSRRPRFLAFTSAGSKVPTAAVDLPVDVLGTWTGEGDGRAAVLVGADRSVWVLGERGDRTLAYALDQTGRIRHGWPYRVTPGLEWLGGECPPQATGCGAGLSKPAVGPGNVLYLEVAAASGRIGGSLTAVGVNGRVRPGWPVVLRRPGAEFRAVVIGTDGTVFAMATEPEAAEADSWTILATKPDSTIRWRMTAVDP